MKVQVVLNEQHNLMDQQREWLDFKYGSRGWELYPVPAAGWTSSQQKTIADRLAIMAGLVVMASPVPVLGMRLAALGRPVLAMPNDRQQKKELPGGQDRDGRSPIWVGSW